MSDYGFSINVKPNYIDVIDPIGVHSLVVCPNFGLLHWGIALKSIEVDSRECAQ